MQKTALFLLLFVFGSVESASLFLSIEETDVTWSSHTSAACRVHRVFPDPALMTSEPVLQKGEKLQLALFDDVVFSTEISRVTQYPNGAVGITAQLEGGPTGTAYLSYCGGRLLGAVEVSGGPDYSIDYDLNAEEHYVSEFGSDMEASEEAGYGRELFLQPLAAEDPAVAADSAGEKEAATVQIDVLIAYTPAARDAEGDVNGINNNIALALEQANQVCLNSETKVQFNLVHSAIADYTEGASAAEDLNELQARQEFPIVFSDALDDVLDWRDTYKADLVCLLADRQDVDEESLTPPSANGSDLQGFSVVSVHKSHSAYALTRAFGFNLGCGGSMSQPVDRGPNLFDYSAGWQWADSGSSTAVGYCTVMTLGGSDYERIPYFSNPSIHYVGNSSNPIGNTSDGDNARTLREMREVVALYRGNIDWFPYGMSFENGASPWDADDAAVEWKRKSGEAKPGFDTGPSSAADGSYYMHFDPDSAHQTGWLHAVFDFSGHDDMDIEFAYHMYGAQVGTLSLEASSDGSNWDSLWSKSGNQSNQWHQTVVSLSSYAGSPKVYLRFNGVSGDSVTLGNMAVDAIVVKKVDGASADADTDNDGLPNDWELQYYGGPTNASPDAIASNGINTVMEAYVAGIDPRDPDAFFELSDFSSSSSEDILQWQNISGRVYSIYWSSNLLSGFEPAPFVSNITSGAFTDTVHCVEDNAFYRIAVELEP